MTTLVTTASVSPGTTGVRRRVPWSTVLPLAVVAAFGNGFWLIAMRGAVGAIERTSAPLLVWLQESALLLPLYVFAVLAAITLALRRFGPGPLRARAVAATLLLVVLATTLASLLVQTAGAVADYRSSAVHVANMVAHIPTCDAECVADRQRAALILQLKALGLGGLVMLVSNLLLLGLTVAFRGGRLAVASLGTRTGSRRPAYSPAGGVRAAATGDVPADRRAGRLGVVEVFLVAGLVGAAAVHGSVVREHFAEWPAAGLFFVLLAIAELDAVGLLLVRLRRVAFGAAALVSAGPILLWVYSRTAGLPFGPHAGVPEQVGLTDVVATVLEAATLVAALVLMRSRRRPARPGGAPAHRTSLAMVGVVALTVVGVAAGLGVLGGSDAVTQEHVHQVVGQLGSGA